MENIILFMITNFYCNSFWIIVVFLTEILLYFSFFLFRFYLLFISLYTRIVILKIQESELLSFFFSNLENERFMERVMLPLLTPCRDIIFGLRIWGA